MHADVLQLSSDVARAPWKAIVVGEIIGPVCLASLFVICYLFVKSFAVDGKVQPGLLRIAIIALGPIVWNMAFLITLFLISVFLGPCVSIPSFSSGNILMLDLVELVDESVRCYYGCHCAFRCCRRHGRILRVPGEWRMLLTVAVLIFMSVVPRALGHFACRSWCYRGHQRSTMYLQDPHRCIPVKRVQA